MGSAVSELATSEQYANNYLSAEFSRLEEYRERLRAWQIDLRGATVLDLGAGPGVWELIFADLGAGPVTWHDYSADFEKLARSLHAKRDIAVNYRRADLLDLADYGDRRFDLVFARDALRYSRNEWRVLEEIARIAHRYIYVESAAWPWSWRGPEGLSWKTIFHLASPLLAVVTRRKLLPTHWQCRQFVSWRLGRHGFFPVWRGYGPWRQSWRVLFQRACAP